MVESLKKKIHPLIMGCIFHYEFVFIHPFADGNGRMARLWHSAIMCKWNPIFAYIPLESQIEKFQDEYYQAIATCHKQGESTKFIEFILFQMEVLLDEINVQLKEENHHLSLQVQALLHIMEYHIPYTSHELMLKLKLTSREGFRRNYLIPALELNLIQMTLPDKPRSKNQRYIKI